MSDESGVGRRAFFKTVGAAAALPLVSLPSAEAQTHDHGAPPPAPGTAYLFLTGPEAAFMEAAVDVFIPKDDVGPGGVESGCVVFIDRQLAGAWGKGARLYLQGPFGDSKSEQGYQLPLAPADLIRIGIADVDAWCRANRDGRTFTQLTATERDALLKVLIEGGNIELAQVPGRTFTGMLLNATLEGYFADPIYGGNRDKGVWKMIGFPGAGGMFAHLIDEYRNKPYTVEPQGIADLG
ncbi:MAG TPA: gluconate 2-dehydrogenase subunit 3 family protein [Alphaproteobacteria bacterium]